MEYTLVEGDVLEGGGQVMRQSVAFSAILGKPMKAVKIRAKRSRPGLRAQHLCGIELVNKICKGKLTGAAVKASEFTFEPHELTAGTFVADTQTAGSVCLLMQVSLPCLFLTGKDCSVELRGGTNASMAPPVDHSLLVLKPYLERFGATMDIDIERRGYYPKGGGCVHITTHLPKDGVFQSVDLTERGELMRITGRSYVAGRVPFHVAQRMAKVAKTTLGKVYKGIPIEIEVMQETAKTSFGTGVGIFLIATTSTGCILAGDCLGERGKRAEVVGESAAEVLMRNIEHGGCVDEHLQDQLIIYMALAEGRSRMLCGELSLHTRTAIHFAKHVAGVEFQVTEDKGCFLVECEGLGKHCVA